MLKLFLNYILQLIKSKETENFSILSSLLIRPKILKISLINSYIISDKNQLKVKQTYINKSKITKQYKNIATKYKLNYQLVHKSLQPQTLLYKIFKSVLIKFNKFILANYNNYNKKHTH